MGWERPVSCSTAKTSYWWEAKWSIQKLRAYVARVTYVKLGEEKSEERRRNGESRAENDSKIANIHLGYIGVLSDDAEIY